MNVKRLRRFGLALGCFCVVASGLAVNSHPDPATASDSLNARERGRRLFTRFQCIACHSMNGEGYSEGVDLTHVAAKLRPDWLREYLQSPDKYPVRHMETDMPGFPLSESELNDLISFFTKEPENKVSASSPAPEPERVREGRLLFESYGCTACHRVGAEKFARVPSYFEPARQAEIARRAPDLQHASRLNRDWAIDFMEKPGRFIPGTVMFNNGAGRTALEKIFDYLATTSPTIPASSYAARD